MSSFAAGTTLTTALVATGDTSGELVFKTNGSTTALTIDASQNATFAGTVSANAWSNLPSALLITTRAGSTTSVSIANGYLAVTNRAGSTINVPVS